MYACIDKCFHNHYHMFPSVNLCAAGSIFQIISGIFLVTISLKTYGNLPPEAVTVCCGTTFLSQGIAYSWPEATTVACGQRPQGFMSYKSWLNQGQMFRLDI